MTGVSNVPNMLAEAEKLSSAAREAAEDALLRLAGEQQQAERDAKKASAATER